MGTRNRTGRLAWDRLAILTGSLLVMLLMAACGDDGAGDGGASDGTANQPVETATEPADTAETATATPTPEPTPSQAATEEPTATAPPPEPTATPEPEPEPEEDVELAPELAGLTDWRNTEPVTLEELRGEPVVLVFWNSI